MAQYRFAFLLASSLLVSTALRAQNKSEFTNFVVTGDSLTAGYQNAQLISTSQVHGYANVIAQQAGVSLNLPLINPPGYPQISIIGGFAAVTGLTPMPRQNNQQTLDVAVPGFKIGDFVGSPASCPPDYTNPISVMAAEILNPNCTLNPAPTELSEAVSLKPSTATMWIGNNDVLLTILFGTPPTDVFTFANSFHQAITAVAHKSGHLIVANIPDVTLVAYLTTVPQLAAILQMPVPVVEQTFGLAPNDEVTPYAFAAIQAMGSSLTTLPDNGPQGPIVARAATLRQIRELVIAYDVDIAIEAAANGATLVDMYSYVNSLAAKGEVINGHKMTFAFGDGFFSLDGIHPTNTGYALLANEFIKVMNRSLGAGIPPVSIEQVAKTDPLFPQTHGNSHGNHVEPGMADALRAVWGRL